MVFLECLWRFFVGEMMEWENGVASFCCSEIFGWRQRMCFFVIRGLFLMKKLLFGFCAYSIMVML